jgi:DNA mismatch endonuclease (patch repair protein)
MSDIYEANKRSEIMSKISGKETKPEILVRTYLFSQGLRFRKNVKNLPGSPDIVLPKYNTVIFIHGCFWHGHEGCKRSKLPETNKKFWKNKINATKNRDLRNVAKLEKMGWKVIIIWQCSLKNNELFNNRMSELIKEIKVAGNSI